MKRGNGWEWLRISGHFILKLTGWYELKLLIVFLILVTKHLERIHERKNVIVVSRSFSIFLFDLLIFSTFSSYRGILASIILSSWDHFYIVYSHSCCLSFPRRRPIIPSLPEIFHWMLWVRTPRSRIAILSTFREEWPSNSYIEYQRLLWHGNKWRFNLIRNIQVKL